MGSRTWDGWELGQGMDGSEGRDVWMGVRAGNGWEARTWDVWMGVRTGDGWELGQGMGGS